MEIDHQDPQSLPKKFKKHKIKLIKKPKPIKYPVYREGIQPAQILNEFNPNLKFEFDVDRSYLKRAKYTCTVQIKVNKKITETSTAQTAQDADLITIGQIANESQGDIFTFVGDGFSKKDAKKKCCHFALLGIYGDTYKPPVDIINYYLQPCEIQNATVNNNAEDQNQKRINEIKKRINKLFNSDTVKRKSPSQLLHELCTKISETGKCVSENGMTAEQKFCFQFNNVAEESIVPIVEQNPMSIIALGYGIAYLFICDFFFVCFCLMFANFLGKSKKEAKSHGAKAALKNFFYIDLDTLMS